ncbi:hemolysin family protein [Jatrophihabitans sp.]|uniref:hemolysin family protein n=1 Tax=Jatrophihabitans sp. TaxID=1932789 RepID=UPI002BD53406|nr:hemolysin family protein [Jatrophihabitans sp.]
MNGTVLNVCIVLALIMVEGLFVGAEIALVSLREGQARAMAESRGRRGQAVARLLADPNRFLAAVQIGVTSTALLSSAFGAVTLSESAKDALVRHGVGDTLAGVIGIVGVTLLISFVTLIVGELAPKRLGLQRPEGAALLFGPTLDRIARLFRPLIWLLSRSTDLVVRVLGGDPHAGRDSISEEELRGLVAAHESLTTDERRLIDDVFAAGERSVSEVMISRTEVVFLEAGLTVSRAVKQAGESPHSRYPVIGQSSDDVLGFVHIRDLIMGAPGVDISADRSLVVGDMVREVKVLPGSKKVLSALSEMRREGHHLAIVVDEYGGTDGIVTLEDLIEEIIGDIRDEYDSEESASRRLTGGIVEVDGRCNLDEFAEYAGFELPDGPYETAGGFLMARLGKLPQVGDRVEISGHVVEVLEIEGRRASRLRVQPLPEPENAAVATG